MAEQFTIPFAHNPDFSVEALIDHAGLVDARAWLAAYPNWPQGLLVLHGPAASGKSHLAAGHTGPVWDLVARPLSSRAEAEALFHAINHHRAHGEPLLILSRQRPAAIYPDLPDLDSRLKAAALATLREPKEEEIRQAIFLKLCADYQLRVDMDVVAYACTRLPQSLEALRRFCELAAQQATKGSLSKIAARPLVDAVEREV